MKRQSYNPESDWNSLAWCIVWLTRLHLWHKRPTANHKFIDAQMDWWQRRLEAIAARLEERECK